MYTPVYANTVSLFHARVRASELTARISSHNFLVTFTTNAYTWFSDITCFQQLRLLSLILRHNTCTYLRKNLNNLGSFLNMRGFFVSLRSLTHTKHLSIPSRMFLLLKNDRIFRANTSPNASTYIPGAILVRKKFFIYPLAQGSIIWVFQ
jgi:hypothetical protein